MESKFLVLIFLSSALASDFYVDVENENPLSRFILGIKYFLAYFFSFSPGPCAASRPMLRASVPPTAPTRTAPPPAPSGSVSMIFGSDRSSRCANLRPFVRFKLVSSSQSSSFWLRSSSCSLSSLYLELTLIIFLAQIFKLLS